MIEVVTGKSERDRKLAGRKSGSVRSADGVAFDSVLSAEVERESNEAVDSLMNDLSEQEKRFLDTQSLFELNKYKLLLQKVLKALVDDSFRTETFPRRSSAKAPFIIINQINQKVDELAKALASAGNKAFVLMKKLEEIRGLICDLRH